MRSPNKKRIKHIPLKPEVPMCKFHPNTPAKTGVTLHGDLLFHVCDSCLTTLRKQ